MDGVRDRICGANVAAAVALFSAIGLGIHAANSALSGARASQPPGAERGAVRPPKVVELFYARWTEGHRLDATTRRTDSLRFATRYRGRHMSAPARVIDDSKKGKLWRPVRGRGARIKKLVRKALEQRGVAKVRTRAKRDDLLDDHWWRIDLDECSQSPPIYPVTCVLPRG